MSGGPLDAPGAEALLALTRAMAVAAGAGDWESVTRHDLTRRELLAGNSPVPLAPPASETLLEALREADETVLSLAREARAALGESSHQVRAERSARGRYADVMRCVASGEET